MILTRRTNAEADTSKPIGDTENPGNLGLIYSKMWARRAMQTLLVENCLSIFERQAFGFDAANG